MIQHDTPPDKIGSVVNARTFQSAVLLSLGDLAVGAGGAIGSTIPLGLDSIWRMLLSLGVALVIIFGTKPKIFTSTLAKGATMSALFFGTAASLSIGNGTTRSQQMTPPFGYPYETSLSFLIPKP